MSKGLHFTPEEEAEFQAMIRFKPRGFSEWMGIKADKVANTIWMFFFLLFFSLVSYVFLKPILNQMLFISNTYQLIALPILGIATGLSMLVILRFLFRILLEIRAEFKELKEMHKEVHSIAVSIQVTQQNQSQDIARHITDTLQRQVLSHDRHPY